MSAVAAQRGPFQKSIATVSLSGTLLEKMQAAAATGYDGVEIFEHDLLNHSGPPAEVRRMAADLGLDITLFQPFRDFEAMPESYRARNLERAERKFDVMLELGAPQILVCSNVQAQALNDPERAAADLHAMAERAQARGLLVGYEALAWGRHVNRWRQAWDIVQQADHPALGLILDSFHTLAVGDSLAGLHSTVPADKLFFVQLADSPHKSMDVLSWSRHYRNFPGQGDLDVVGFTRELVRTGYSGPLSLEIFNDEFRAASAYLIAHDGLRSLLWVEAEAGATTLPAPPNFGGYEFLEFAVDANSAPGLGRRLRALGFEQRGVHRSKAVTLYGQGDILLTLNSEPDSHAADFFQVHGPSVCAIGLRVDDVPRALDRARALLCNEWEERTGQGESPLPALRAPNGMLFSFVDEALAARLYHTDFHLTAPVAGSDEDLGAASGGEGPSAGAGLLGIDHVAQALPPDRLGSFILFYRTVFGLEPEPLHEIPDPYGLVSSRAMVSPNRRISFPLNISESRRTATGRFVNALSGAGVHHIAFTTADLPQTVTALDAAAAELLEIPDNYYDDLDVRYLLPPRDLDILRGLHLLYDQDASGEFRQLYTHTFDDRFFFEVVQRDGYLGYGAANASVRMNALMARRALDHAGGQAEREGGAGQSMI
ncbi:bifunctional sugar phosphate isomerase/epimerase/4-hydroxyphenylpyruvate dioxygenase family protein [Deinococcus sp. QL22]|uniref:bifunctional sugar phosphate isomerase/epimerase/4-hydroxyphenylpyruvate dioxygenase family protein n=1 Tax=Deinococcus sp. QL22 TaxID=2939437 RepID=UPI002017631E|nr:sugar phosphate isomerase/epimerase and 4-hydroxyphenylpyruvate domain-containing protein [Deinococcus sp. QL22]UQN10254.1 sugar phosphate isomerase/epimerase and 4-hydroxyphenylpyruvate domain-containing protein [Deinococcus sp. QL22]